MSHFLFPTVAVLTSVLTFLANKKMGAIRASSGLTLVSIGLLTLLPPEMIETDMYANLVFGASFVGMSSPKTWTIAKICMAGLVYSVYFLVLAPYFPGHGGTLGMLAFISCVATVSFSSFLGIAIRSFTRQ